ncbi:hypothetical protein THAOC_11035, partial [Thalassiosira oceanica]
SLQQSRVPGRRAREEGLVHPPRGHHAFPPLGVLQQQVLRGRHALETDRADRHGARPAHGARRDGEADPEPVPLAELAPGQAAVAQRAGPVALDDARRGVVGGDRVHDPRAAVSVPVRIATDDGPPARVAAAVPGVRAVAPERLLEPALAGRLGPRRRRTVLHGALPAEEPLHRHAAPVGGVPAGGPPDPPAPRVPLAATAPFWMRCDEEESPPGNATSPGRDALAGWSAAAPASPRPSAPPSSVASSSALQHLVESRIIRTDLIQLVWPCEFFFGVLSRTAIVSTPAPGSTPPTEGQPHPPHPSGSSPPLTSHPVLRDPPDPPAHRRRHHLTDNHPPISQSGSRLTGQPGHRSPVTGGPGIGIGTMHDAPTMHQSYPPPPLRSNCSKF